MTISSLRDRLKLDPYLLALAGTVAIAALLPARGISAEVLDKVVTVAIAALFFLYGARLAPQAVLAGLAHWRLQSIVFLSTYLLFPLLGLAATWLLRPYLAPELALGLVFVCALPSTVQSSVAFTSIARGNVPAALCSASVSNLLGVVLTPALLTFLMGTHGTGLSVGTLEKLTLQLLLPFFAGQLMRPLVGDWLLRHKPVTSLFDRGSILLVVYAAFSEGMVAGIWGRISLPSLGIVALADFAILAIVLVLTGLVSRIGGFSKEDEIAIVFCGSKKSMASGIPMANILFPSTAVGMIVLPLMLFHQAQLFACAALAQRYARRRADRDGPERVSPPTAATSLA
ncbi:bile acid:sodium symporter [Roseomonas sp. KE2513]|uniref:bile acid:sodium symporter family protein n=1 Tax=Roseomonas sp. KE2513 TaxID=2479202 RepID=UPI0018E04FAA|nr:bile acid:sodium symporter family protein [Roseomonas sp. KE2513]MBI0539387.1 bile acid:sodium symporter [Roseomonas sp. KE2513]